MALLDFFKKKKKVEQENNGEVTENKEQLTEVNQASQPEVLNIETLSVEMPPKEQPINNAVEVTPNIQPTVPLETNQNVAPMPYQEGNNINNVVPNMTTTEIVEPTNFVEPVSIAEPNYVIEPTSVAEPISMVEPINAETVPPVNNEISNTIDTNIENPTPEVVEVIQPAQENIPIEQPITTETPETNEITEETSDDENKFCPNCGNMESGGTIICSNCGSRL